MENLYKCPICGSTEMKQTGTRFLCRFCRNEFSKEDLDASMSAGSGGSAGCSGSSGAGNGSGVANGAGNGDGVGNSSGNGVGLVPGTGSVNTPASGYIGTMFGVPSAPQGFGGFSAPPDSLVQSIQANAARNRQNEAERTVLNENGSGDNNRNTGRASGGNNGGGSGRRNSSGSSRADGTGNANGRNGNIGNASGNGRNGNIENASGNGGNSNIGNGSGSGRGGNNIGAGNGNGRSSQNNNSGNNGGCNSGSGSSVNNIGASDSENNVRFLDNVSLMNDLAYELVNGNANAWANIARDRGIINSKQHTEIKYIVATRNCIAHGSGDTVRITAELVQSARDYYELMRRTASQIK